MAGLVEPVELYDPGVNAETTMVGQDRRLVDLLEQTLGLMGHVRARGAGFAVGRGEYAASAPVSAVDEQVTGPALLEDLDGRQMGGGIAAPARLPA